MPSRSNAAAKAGSCATRRCTSSLKSRVTAIARLRSSRRRPAPPLVVRPQLVRSLDIALLALLGAACEQDDQHLAVATEVNPVARPQSIRYSGTPSPTLFAFEVLPCPSRTNATDAFAAAAASTSENQLSNGLCLSPVR